MSSPKKRHARRTAIAAILALPAMAGGGQDPGPGVQVREEGILAGFDGQGLMREGDTWTSPDWESAANRFTIHLDAAPGSIRVAWVDGDRTACSGWRRS